jgi:hypothetical protein
MCQCGNGPIPAVKIGVPCLSLVGSINMDRMAAFFFRAAMLVGSVFLGHESAGQWEVRVLAGGGLGQIRTELYPATSRGEYQVVDRRFSWLLGGSATHKLSGPLSFSTGLYWSFIAGHDEYWQQDRKFLVEDRQVHYLCLPMMVNVEVHRFHLGAGYQLATPLIESGTFAYYYSVWGVGLEDKIIDTKDLGLKHTDLGVLGEFGYRISDRMDIGARYYYGLQDIKDHTDGTRSPLMNEQLVLTVSYRILPKRRAKAEEAPVQEPVPAE